MSSFNSDSKTGVALAEHLGLQLPKREGHDLAGPCISCRSSDAFRLHQQTGVAQCYSCGGKWSPFQLAEAVLKDRERARSLMVEIGVFQPNGTSAPALDPITAIALSKGITPDSLLAFGARATSPREVELPAYGPDGKNCTTFTMWVKGGKGLFAKGKKAGLFFPHVDGKVRLPKPGETWHLVEGPKDAAALHGLGLLACGANTCRLAAKFARLFAGTHVILVPDRDRAGEEGSQFSAKVLRGVAKSVRIAVLPAEFKQSEGADVRDVLRNPGGRDLVMQAIEDAQAWDAPTSNTVQADDRPTITITTDEHLNNDDATAALARDDTIYQRGGILVRVVRDTSPAAKGVRRTLAPRIEPLPPALLRERLAANAKWETIRQTKDGEITIPARPPAWCIAAVHARASWPGVRHLESVVEYPVLRPDGTILNVPGYDSDTGLLLEPAGSLASIMVSPSRSDALAARDALLEVVADFPFKHPVHRATWLAALLTPLARFAFVGPAPLFLVDANVRAAGKGLLLNCISRIVTGEAFTIATYTQDEDELRKRITSLAMAGDRLVLFDNLEGRFGNAVLDAALTGTSWKDRVLGYNRMAESPLFMTWYATGNNVAVAADTGRRTCHCQLESPEERPEERSKFRHPDLLGWVGTQRDRLLTAALTILRAYCAAGRPDMALPAWGSFEGWSALVRSAVVWVDLPDPGASRLMLQESSDVTAENMELLLACWERMDTERRGLTAAEVIQMYKNAPDLQADWHADLTVAIEMLLAKPDARSLGTKLRSYRRRIFGGRFIDRAGDDHRAARWAVFPATEFYRRSADTRAHSSHSPHSASACEEEVSVTSVDECDPVESQIRFEPPWNPDRY